MRTGPNYDDNYSFSGNGKDIDYELDKAISFTEHHTDRDIYDNYPENDKNDFFVDLFSSSSGKRVAKKNDDDTVGSENMRSNSIGDVSISSLSNRSRNKKLKKKRAILNTALSMVLVIASLITGVLGILAYLTEDTTYSEISSNHEDLGISSEAAATLPKGITNIALFGLDSRDRSRDNSKSISGRSDSIIIVSINANDNTIKLTSILRDSWVPIKGHKNDKINAAYAYGGAQLAINTLNSNFGLNITDYASVSLFQLWSVIDVLGGIDIHVTEAERVELNRLSNSEGFGVNKLNKTGFVHLDGGQAMTYARIRHIDGDDVRAMRQQKVLNCLFEKVKAMSASKYPSVLKEVLSHVETSMDFDEIFAFKGILTNGNIKLETNTIPGDGCVGRGGVFKGSDSGNAWVWKYDLDEAKKYIRKWIYDIND